jgi:hypothetical protein
MARDLPAGFLLPRRWKGAQLPPSNAQKSEPLQRLAQLVGQSRQIPILIRGLLRAPRPGGAWPTSSNSLGQREDGRRGATNSGRPREDCEHGRLTGQKFRPQLRKCSGWRESRFGRFASFPSFRPATATRVLSHLPHVSGRPPPARRPRRPRRPRPKPVRPPVALTAWLPEL